MIDLGLNQDQMEKLARPPLLPDGTYEFSVDHIDEQHLNPDGTPDGTGRPRWNWWLRVINRPDIANRMVPYGTSFPWKDPNGEIITSGIGFLNDILNGIGVQLSGTKMAPKETYYGRTGVMKLGQRIRQKKNPADPDEEEVIDQSVKIVTKKRGGGVVA